MEDILRCDGVSYIDKRRLITCYKKQEVCPVEDEKFSFARNTSVRIGDFIYLYRINLDKSVEYLKTLRASDYQTISFA